MKKRNFNFRKSRLRLLLNFVLYSKLISPIVKSWKECLQTRRRKNLKSYVLDAIFILKNVSVTNATMNVTTAGNTFWSVLLVKISIESEFFISFTWHRYRSILIAIKLKVSFRLELQPGTWPFLLTNTEVWPTHKHRGVANSQPWCLFCLWTNVFILFRVCLPKYLNE